MFPLTWRWQNGPTSENSSTGDLKLWWKILDIICNFLTNHEPQGISYTKLFRLLKIWFLLFFGWVSFYYKTHIFLKNLRHLLLGDLFVNFANNIFKPNVLCYILGGLQSYNAFRLPFISFRQTLIGVFENHWNTPSNLTSKYR